LFDQDGKLIDHPAIDGSKDFGKEQLRFSHGVLFSQSNGVIYYSTSGVEKKIPKNHLVPSDDSSIKTGVALKFPDRIDGFVYEQIVDVDDAGNLYARYYGTSDDDAAWPPTTIYHMYKFDAKCHLLAGFDFIRADMNRENETVYQLETISNYLRIVKWEKQKKGVRPPLSTLRNISR